MDSFSMALINNQLRKRDLSKEKKTCIGLNDEYVGILNGIEVYSKRNPINLVYDQLVVLFE